MVERIFVFIIKTKCSFLNRLHAQLILLIAFLSSCADGENFGEVVNNGEVFNFLLENQQSDTILESFGVEVVVDNPKPWLSYSGRQIECSKFETRGQSSLGFRRKSFNVNLEDRAEVYDFSGTQSYSDDFKLLSLSMDYTYVNNRLAFKLYNHIGLWDLHTFYTEVALNGQTQGLYLFVQDPVDYFKRVLNSDFIIRRGYHGLIKRFSRNKSSATQSDEQYITQFNSIYQVIREYDGEELYNRLSNYLDVEEYLQKIALDYLLMNGDYTDELYLYLKEKNGRQVYGVLPWDYDDIFSELPHEIGRDWAVGKLFGVRQYMSIEDVQNDVGSKMLFSIEDDLDYKIASDNYLYPLYIQQLSDLMTTLDEATLTLIIDEVLAEVRPFYEEKEIIEQSKYDRKETSKVELFENVANIKEFLIERRNRILREL